LNLAVILDRLGQSAGLLDACSGAGGLGLLCGQNGYWNLAHVLAGVRSTGDVTLNEQGVRILPGGVNLLSRSSSASSLPQDLIDFENELHWLIVDTGAHREEAHQFARSADVALVVTTPEPTAVAEAYAAIKSLSAEGVANITVLVNQADSDEQARMILIRLRHAARAFFGGDISFAGAIPFDPAVGQSVCRRVPLANVEPEAPAVLAIEQVARRLSRIVSRRHVETYVGRLHREAQRKTETT
jgi:flagellar biosynthesis protein FlhG